mmetsp:Transcript_55909/g.166305  ORF Transcript_55909/g.166305 Transcript_55909/m.166305 type:complete len:286 (-) Transcript_55909:345-1202(-)
MDDRPLTRVEEAPREGHTRGIQDDVAPAHPVALHAVKALPGVPCGHFIILIDSPPHASCQYEPHDGEHHGQEEEARRHERRDVQQGCAPVCHIRALLVPHDARDGVAHDIHRQEGNRNGCEVVLALLGLLLPHQDGVFQTFFAEHSVSEKASEAEERKQHPGVQDDGCCCCERASRKHRDVLHVAPCSDGREGRHVGEEGGPTLEAPLPRLDLLLILLVACGGHDKRHPCDDHVQRNEPDEEVHSADDQDVQVALTCSMRTEALQNEVDEDAVHALEDEHGGEYR